MSEQRKRDARLKIQLGALVVKAGLSEVDSGFLLGILLDASSRLNDEFYFHRFKKIGDQAFQKEPLSMERVE